VSDPADAPAGRTGADSRDDRPDRGDDDRADGTGGDASTSRARVRFETVHDDPEAVAASVAPDNTDRIDTRVVDGRVRTTVERGDAAGLAATADDYLVNLDVAARTTAVAVDAQHGQTDSDNTTDTNDDT
jgi:hypothetical protein